MTEPFRTSSGRAIHKKTMGGLRSDNWEIDLKSSEVDSLREYFLWEAKEQFQAQRDAALGRWRSPVEPDCVVYPTALGDVVGSVMTLVVVNELTGLSHSSQRGAILRTPQGRAARLYFDAHPIVRPKPWEDARFGEVWALSITGKNHEPYTMSEARFQGRLDSFMRDDERIVDGYPLWQNGAPVQNPGPE